MYTKSKTIFASVIIILMVFPSMVSAQFKFRNKCKKDLLVAISYVASENDNNNFTTKGWFTIPAGKTVQVVSTPLIAQYFYYYAYSPVSGIYFSGKSVICASFDRFNYYSFFTSKQCDVKLPFVELDIGEATNFFCDLSPRP